MIRLNDGALLAITKLRTRKVRTVVTIVTASLLFGGLIGATLVVGGVVQSTKSFTKGGLSDRYITNVQYFGATAYDTNSSTLQSSATKIYDKLVKDKKAESARLGVDYDSSMEQKPVVKDPSGGGAYLDTTAPSAQQAIDEYMATQPTDLERVQKLAAPYHPVKVYDMQPNNMPGSMTLMENGLEDFKKPNGVSSYMNTADVSQGWGRLNTSLATPFLLSKEQLATQKNTNDLPIIAPYSKVEAELGLKKLSKNATATEQMERIATVRGKAAGVTFTACYRNEVSSAQIIDARQAADDAKRQKDNADYQKPSLQYGLPAADSCAAAPTVRDDRSAMEKQQTSKEMQFMRTFNEPVDPVQQKVTFRVVGLSPDGMTDESFSTVGMLISAVAGSSLQGLWVVPQGMYDAMPNKADYARFEPSSTASQQPMNMVLNSQLVEFATAADAKAFVTNVGCADAYCSSDKPYVNYFGSNSVLLDDMVKGTTKVMGIAALVVAAIAAFIMMGMVGRVIGDSRRETAVFRAIGAKRNDIRAIYVIYTIFLSSFVAVAALIIGAIAALWVDSKWSAGATAQAQITFVGAHETMQFHLIGLWWQALVAIIIVVILTGLVSMLLPLSRNLARSPIKDMRDDT